MAMNRKLYTPVQRYSANKWAEKWLELSALIIEVTGTDEPPLSPPIPTELDELYYGRFRFWLMDNETQFISLWQDFYACQGCALHFGGDNVIDVLDDDELMRNPFSFSYKPENLYRLAREFDLQSGIDIWEPSELRARMSWGILIQMGQILIEFLNWMDERISEER